MIVPSSMTLDSFLTSRLIETVSFNDQNFVDDFDENVFCLKKEGDIFLNNLPIHIVISESSENILKGHAIMSVFFKGKEIKLLIKSKFISKINRIHNKIIDSEDWITLFMKFQKTTQKEGKKIKDTIYTTNNYIRNIEGKQVELVKNKAIIQDACTRADNLAKLFLCNVWNSAEEMLHCGLTSDEMTSIEQYSAGVYCVTEFLQNVAPTLSRGSTIIGLNHKNIIQGFREALKFDDYLNAYQRIFNDFRARDDFLEKLTAENQPIIFLVPHQLFGNQQGVTAREMRWFLKNPGHMKNVHFVFASYKIYSKQIIASLSLANEDEVDFYKTTLTKRIFKQLQYQMTLQKKDVDAKIFKKKVLLINLKEAKPKTFYRPVVHLPSFAVCDYQSKVISNFQPRLTLSFTKLTRAYDFNKAIFLMGGAGSGKGKIRDAIINHHPNRNYVIVDPDLIKGTIPGYQQAINHYYRDAGTLYQQESVSRATQLLKEMIKIKANFIYDSTGSRSWIYEEQMVAAKENGMSVELIYVSTKVETCLQRAEERGLREGRFVPEDKIRESNEYAAENFDDFKRLAHKWKKYNNDGSSPILEEFFPEKSLDL